MEIQGAKELERKLRKLGDQRAGIKLLRQSMVEPMRPMLEEARRNAPEFLRKSIKLRRPKLRNGKMNVSIVCKDHMGLWFEYGTRGRWWKSGRYTGEITEQPFIRPAWDHHRNGLMQKMINALWAGVKRLAGR